MNQLLTDLWIPQNEALRIAQTYPKGPHTKAGLIRAGERGKFSRKAEDGFHWLFNKVILEEFCSLCSNSQTLSGLAHELGVAPGSIQYHAMKNRIEMTYIHGRKFLSQESVNKLRQIFRSKS